MWRNRWKIELRIGQGTTGLGEMSKQIEKRKVKRFDD